MLDAAYKAVDAKKGKEGSLVIDAVDENKSRNAYALFGAFETSAGDYETTRMEDRFFRVAENAGIANLFSKVRALPEDRLAMNQWRDSYIGSLRLPPEVTIDFLKLVIRRDVRTVSEGQKLPPSALKAIVRKWPDPDVVWAPIAIAAMQGNLKLVRSYLKNSRRPRKLPVKLPRRFPRTGPRENEEESERLPRSSDSVGKADPIQRAKRHSSGVLTNGATLFCPGRSSYLLEKLTPDHETWLPAAPRRAPRRPFHPKSEDGRE